MALVVDAAGGNVLDERGVPDLGGSSQLDLHLNGFGGGCGGVVDNGVPVEPDAGLAVHLEGGLGALEDQVKDGLLVRDLTFGDCLDLQVEAEAFSQGHLKGFPWWRVTGQWGSGRPRGWASGW